MRNPVPFRPGVPLHELKSAQCRFIVDDHRFGTAASRPFVKKAGARNTTAASMSLVLKARNRFGAEQGLLGSAVRQVRR